MTQWVKIGEVGVDSGQLMICDPCYLDSHWRQTPFKDIRVYRDKKTNKLYAYDTEEARKLEGIYEYFSHYEQTMSDTGLTPNQHNRRKDWEPVDEAIDSSFSYNGVCKKGSKPFKQVNYPLGHAGLAVAFSSGFGDGCYDVMAKVHKDRVLEVKIVMVSQETVDEIISAIKG